MTDHLRAEIDRAIEAAAGYPQSVLVAGDGIYDEYVDGFVERISPEMPVPVFVETGRKIVPGGAWNAVHNVRAAGIARSYFIGNMNFADWAALEEENSFDITGFNLVSDPPRKTRIVAQHGQHIVRMDTPRHETLTFLSVCAAIDAGFATLVRKKALPSVILLSDYAEGFVGPKTVRNLKSTFGVPIVVDPHPKTDPTYYIGASAVLPNQREYEEIRKKLTKDQMQLIAPTWVIKNGAGPVRITIDGVEYDKVQPPSNKCVDPCGAGDVFAAYFVAALSCGRGVYESTVHAVRAAAYSVTIPGTVVVEADKLSRSMPGNHGLDDPQVFC